MSGERTLNPIVDALREPKDLDCLKDLLTFIKDIQENGAWVADFPVDAQISNELHDAKLYLEAYIEEHS